MTLGGAALTSVEKTQGHSSCLSERAVTLRPLYQKYRKKKQVRCVGEQTMPKYSDYFEKKKTFSTEGGGSVFSKISVFTYKTHCVTIRMTNLSKLCFLRLLSEQVKLY
jgi:hypothetical protein